MSKSTDGKEVIDLKYGIYMLFYLLEKSMCNIFIEISSPTHIDY